MASFDSNYYKQPFTLILLFLSGIILLFIISPLIGMIIQTSTSNFFETCSDQEVQNSIKLTISVSFLSTLFFAFFAIPFAYLLARKDFLGKGILQGIIDLPIVIPHSAAGIALLGFLSRNTTLGKFAESIGINFVGHPLGIGVAMAFVSLPYMVNSARDGFANVPERLEKASLSLGASAIRTFFSISVPLAKRNIITGFILMFARGMSEFGAVIIIAYHPMVTPVLIFDRFSSYGLENARTISVIFISISLVFFVILRFLSKDKNLKK